MIWSHFACEEEALFLASDIIQSAGRVAAWWLHLYFTLFIYVDSEVKYMACCFRVFCVTAFVTRGIQLLISQPLFWKFFWNWVLKQRHITSLQRLSCLCFELSKDQERGYNHLPAAVMWGHSCQPGLLKWWHRSWFFVGFHNFISLTSLKPNNWWVRHLQRCGCWSQSSTGLGVFSKEQILSKVTQC